MKKSIVYSVAFVFIISLRCSTVAFSQNRSVRFEQGTWQEIMKKAKAENKIIFLASYWDVESNFKFLDTTIFFTDAVADFYNQHFISYRINPNKGEGPLLAARYHIESSSAFLFIDDWEEVLHRDYSSKIFLDSKGTALPRGYYTKGVSEFMALGETALNPETRFEAWETKYRKGNREPSFIRQYIKMLRPVGNEEREMADWYFTTQKNEDLMTKENFEMIKQYVRSYESPAFQYLVAQRVKFREMFGADEVDKKIFEVYQHSLNGYDISVKSDGTKVFEIDDKRINRVKEELKKSGFERAEELLMSADLWYYGEKRDAKRYAEVAAPYVNKYRANDYDYLNYTAWYFYAHDEITNTILLNQALVWAKKSVDAHPCVAAYDAYASLLYKLNRKNEALKAIETAIDLRKKEGEDIASSKYLLDKIQAMK